MKTAPLCLLALTGLLVGACSSSGWNGKVETYGTLREVLGQGEDAGRVVVNEAASPTTVGLGALEGLGGEVVVFEGQVYTGRVHSGQVVTHRATPSDQAAFLAVTEVPEWEELRVARTTSLAQLGPLLEELSTSGKLQKADAFPFVVEGELLALRSHVINGACPIAHPDGPPPARQTAERANGRLVGFYSKLPPGTLTHHGSPLHVHVLIAGKDPLVAHVDEVQITAGSTLLVPKP